MTYKQEIASGARSVEAEDHSRSGLTAPENTAEQERSEASALGENPAQTPLGEMTLKLFQQGKNVRVRIGSPFNAADLYEGVYDSAEEANSELSQAGILDADDVQDPNASAKKLTGLTAEQLLRAGLKRHHTAGM